jgi:hypothetical protein
MQSQKKPTEKLSESLRYYYWALNVFRGFGKNSESSGKRTVPLWLLDLCDCQFWDELF